MKCVSSPYIQPVTERKQIKFPKSKKVRIRKKWFKNPKNWITVAKDVFYVWGNTIILNPKHYNELLKIAK